MNTLTVINIYVHTYICKRSKYAFFFFMKKHFLGVLSRNVSVKIDYLVECLICIWTGHKNALHINFPMLTWCPVKQIKKWPWLFQLQSIIISTVIVYRPWLSSIILNDCFCTRFVGSVTISHMTIHIKVLPMANIVVEAIAVCGIVRSPILCTRDIQQIKFK